MVSLSLIDKLGLRGRIEPCKLKLRAFGEIKMILKVAGVEVNSKFVISDQLDNNFLLGFPDMVKNKLEIKPAEGIFKSPKEAVEFISTPQNIKRSYEVKCKKTTIIPKNTVKYIWGGLPNKIKHNVQGVAATLWLNPYMI